MSCLLPDSEREYMANMAISLAPFGLDWKSLGFFTLPSCTLDIAMEIESKTFGVPLYKKNRSPFWFALGCIGVAAISLKASRLSQWLTAIFVLGPTFWVAFGGPMFIHRWQNNPASLLRGLFLVLRLAFLLGVLWQVAPFVVALLDGVLPPELAR